MRVFGHLNKDGQEEKRRRRRRRPTKTRRRTTKGGRRKKRGERGSRTAVGRPAAVRRHETVALQEHLVEYH